ncbi:MAG: hypothetical protein RBR40_09855 [Tenuifilaceae bacterium]|nr:hypothetical protein [Tenuifilaceae bacterium]
MSLISKNRKLAIMRFLNSYPLQELFLLLKYHKLKRSEHKEPMLIISIDGRRNTQGLADRFSGIVSMYALSKALNVPFRCMFIHPFNLTDFLQPNIYDWSPKEEEISESINGVRYCILRKSRSVGYLLKRFPIKKQIRVYANLNYLDEINKKFGQNFIWSELFNELFRFTPELEEQLNMHKEMIGGKYIACVFRYQSLLGDFKEYRFRPVSEKEQKELIEKNKNALRSLAEDVNMPVLVTSDSQRFISEVKHLKNIFTLPGRVVHLDCTHNEQKQVYMKSFIDFFMISGAEKAFSMGTSKMYPTGFPLCAARLGNIPFNRILVE